MPAVKAALTCASLKVPRPLGVRLALFRQSPAVFFEKHVTPARNLLLSGPVPASPVSCGVWHPGQPRTLLTRYCPRVSCVVRPPSAPSIGASPPSVVVPPVPAPPSAPDVPPAEPDVPPAEPDVPPAEPDVPPAEPDAPP